MKKKMVQWVMLLAVITVVSGSLSAQEEEGEAMGVNHLIYAYFSGTKKKPTDAEIDGFIASVLSDEYARSRNNEFEWRTLWTKGISLLNEGIAGFDASKVYSTMTRSSFSNYDFDKGGFAVGVTNSMSLSTRLGNFTTVLTNNGDFDFLKMTPEEGNAFIKLRTSEYTNSVNRDIVLVVNFKFADYSNKTFQDLIRNRSGYYVHALIQSVDVYYIGNVWDGDLHYVGKLSKK